MLPDQGLCENKPARIECFGPRLEDRGERRRSKDASVRGKPHEPFGQDVKTGHAELQEEEE